ncbi:hypothetical protein MMC25_006077 [Agyrium rufum]|nr:hypothetical protein [Agyrium rufum]
MLHGYTQSGPLFRSKTRALEKTLQKAFPGTTLTYPSGPIPLRASDIPGFQPSSTPSHHSSSPATTDSSTANREGAQSGTVNGEEEEPTAFAWWRRKDGSSGPVYTGIEEGLARVAQTIRSEGPFDGAIGFSQGGCVAPMVASLLESGRREAMDALHAREEAQMRFPSSFLTGEGVKGQGGKEGEEGSPVQIQEPLKFVVQYSGFRAPAEFYDGFYEPRIRTPVLHFLGGLDTVVDEGRTRALIDACEEGEGRVIVHPGGHFVPSGKAQLDVVVGFIRECLKGENGERKNEEESVEDMDVPF